MSKNRFLVCCSPFDPCRFRLYSLSSLGLEPKIKMETVFVSLVHILSWRDPRPKESTFY